MLLATRLSGGGEEAEIALDGAALVLGEAIARLPQRDVGLHGYFGRHPVIVAAGEVFLPCPFVFQRQQLIDVGAAIDHSLVVDQDAAAASVDGAEAGRVGHGREAACATPVAYGGRARRVLTSRAFCYSFSVAHWQASHSGLSIEQATAPDKSGIADIDEIEATALSLPSVPFKVDFSTCVALRERK